MAGKKKVEKEPASWAGGIEKNSRQIWLAGLGAYAKSSTDGSKAFDALVKEGAKVEKQARGDAAKLAETAKVVNSAKASASGKAKPKPLGKWGELEDAFDTRLDTAISRLGVASRDEVAALNTKVDLLMQELQRLSGAPAAKGAVKPAAVKPATAKPAAAKPANDLVEKVVVAKKPRARKAPVEANEAAAPQDEAQPL
jgi:poly(hydroxyalkanoate) granule-associated protein